VAEALPKRPRRYLDAGRESALGMTGGDAPPLTKLLDLFERKVVTGRVEQAVQQPRSVPRREDKTVAVEPAGIRRIVSEETGPQHIGHRRAAQRQSRMAAVGLLNGTDR